MDSKLTAMLQAEIGDLLIRYPLYHFRKKQGNHYLLRILLAVKKEVLYAALTQMLPAGQLLDTRLEITVCGAALEDRDMLLASAPDLRRFVCITDMDDITEGERALARLSFRSDFPTDPAQWDYALIDGGPVLDWAFDSDRLIAVIDGLHATVPYEALRGTAAGEHIAEELLQEIAFNIHYGYQKYNIPRASMEEIREGFEKNYNRVATLENVMHIRSKMACCGILDTDLNTAARRFAAYMKDHPEIVSQLAEVEHNRWLMGKVMQGFCLPRSVEQVYQRSNENTHSEEQKWHVCILPCGHSHRLNTDDWRAGPNHIRPELDPLDRRSLEVHYTCKKIADGNREQIFDLLRLCKRGIDRYSDSGPLDKTAAAAYLNSMHSAVSHMYQKKRIAAYRFDKNKRELLKLLKSDSSIQADSIRSNIDQIDQYLKALREYIIDKDYKEQDHLMVRQIPFALTHRYQPNLVKFFDVNGSDSQFSPWQLESKTVTYIGLAYTGAQLAVLHDKASHIRRFLEHSCSRPSVHFHILVCGNVPDDRPAMDYVTLHHVTAGGAGAFPEAVIRALDAAQPVYMDLTDISPALSGAAGEYAAARGIGTFHICESQIHNISGAEELEYPALTKGITVLEMFKQAGAVLAGCESADLSDLQNVYRDFWKVSRTTNNWRHFCDFISEAYRAQKAEMKYPLLKERKNQPLQERTVRLNAHVLNKLLPSIREMEANNYIRDTHVEWLIGDTLKLTFHIRGQQPADRMEETLNQIAEAYDSHNCYYIKWSDGKPTIEVGNLKLRDAKLPADSADEYRQLLKGLAQANVINHLNIRKNNVSFEFATAEFLFALRNSGKVLEYYLYYTALQECQFDDAELSWMFFHSAHIDAAENELDVICTKGNTSLFISAKNVNLDTFHDAKFLNYVCYEVTSLASAFGINARTVLAAPRVPQFEENGELGHYVRRALSRGVYLLGDKCFEDGNLSRVLDRIARGDEDWCKFLLDTAAPVCV